MFKAYAMSEKSSPVKFIPVDRINMVIAVAPNPGIFVQVREWLDKLDIAVKAQAGEVSTYVYRLKYYGRAENSPPWPSRPSTPVQTSGLSWRWPR